METRIFWLIGALGLWSGLSGCAIHRVDEEEALPRVEVPATFGEADSLSASDVIRDDDSWWASFEDPVLSDLVEQGLEGSFSLQGFVARIEQAMALSKQSGGALFPSLTFAAGADAEWDGAVATGDSL